MTDADVDSRIRAATVPFLRGDVGVPDFTQAFRAAASELSQTRPLQGKELSLFYALEAWEEAGWAERPAVVDRLRGLARAVQLHEG